MAAGVSCLRLGVGDGEGSGWLGSGYGLGFGFVVGGRFELGWGSDCGCVVPGPVQL